jgi:hypothetical protein
MPICVLRSLEIDSRTTAHLDRTDPGLSLETVECSRCAEMARLAYTLWQQRGCPVGSAEVDWLEAEQQLSR